MDRVVLTLKGAPDQEAELEDFLAQQQDPSSPHFHEWLTPQQFGERFGASAADMDVITGWLQSHGMRINAVANGRRQIEFSGTARQIEEAFQTEIHNYEFNGEMHVANATDISIPDALAPVVSGVVSLHDFRPKPKYHRQAVGTNFTFGSNHGIVPYDFATIYDVAALWNEGLDGTGQTIAIAGRSNLHPDDVATFRSQSGLPVNPPDIIVNGTDPGTANPDEEGEADLDVEWSGAVAKGATIKFVVSQSTRSTDGSLLSEMYIVNNNLAPILSTSFGFCEIMSPKTSLFYATLWQQAAAQGMSVFVASGDSGAAACDDPSETAATLGISVDGEASTPYAVAVGGSEFSESGSNSTYWNATNSPQNRSSVKSYIPEVAWNESGSAGLWSGGGGVSTVHATPSWQVGSGVPTVDPGTTSQHHRYVPDVSLNAAGHDGYVGQQDGSLVLFSGTSASAPSFAGIMAIVNQATNRANGNPNPTLYALAAQVPAAFHDITSGTNSVPCVAGSPNCSANGTVAGYTATQGYDLVTGWGSVDAYRLVHAWAGTATVPQPVTITTSSTLTSTMAGTALSVSLTATGGTPPYQWSVTTGSLPPGVALDPGGALSGTPTVSGAYSFTISVTDSTGTGSSQTFQLTITSPVTGGGGSSTTAATYHVFPQFADGRVASDGTYYRTTLMISNTSSSNANCALQLRGLTVPGFALNYPVATGSWIIAPTSGTQSLQTGYATLQCDTKVEAQLLYSYYSPTGTKLSEATVFSSPPSSTVRVIANQTESAQLGLAIANDSDQTVSYTISMTGMTGTATVTLSPRASVAKFLNQLLAGVPNNGVGVVQVVASNNGTASVIGLRFTGSIFTTIPESLPASVSTTANTYHVFPQFADGKFANGTSYRTTRMYLNSSPTATANCTTQLEGVSTDGFVKFTASLPPGQFVVTPSSGTQVFQSGYLTMSCPSSPVDAQELYSYYAADGTKLSEATVFSSPASKTVQILADSRESAQIGLAIANDSDQTNSYSVVVTDLYGNVLGSTTQTLNPRSSIAKFLTDFMTLPPNYVGRATVSSNTGMASIIGLRYTGNVFTTIPEAIAQ